MKHNRRVVRIVAIVLAVLLAGSVVVGALFAAMAEEAPARDRCTLNMEYIEEAQALHIEQRLVYCNDGPDPLDRVVFYAAPNMLRRESALMYENDDLEAVFFAGYAPGGLDLRSVRVDGGDADYGFQGEDELYLRVACDLAPGASAAFDFDYYLLLPECGAFVGVGAEDVRLGAFCFIPGVYDPGMGEFNLKKPLPFTRWLYSRPTDYEVKLSLPEGCMAAATGAQSGETFIAENVREFALAFGRRWRVTERETSGGVRVRVFTGLRSGGRIAEMAVRAVEHCAEWFGTFPVDELDIAQSDYPLGTLNYPGLVLVSSDLMQKGGEDLEQALRFCAAQQVFGLSAYVEPSADAWLSDSLCNYLAYMMLEADRGRDAFLKAINRDWVSDLQLTVPGGLRVTSDASLFEGKTYETVVMIRGAVVFHELREAMGAEDMLAGLKLYREMGADGRTLTEMDLVHALDQATGKSWEDFLTDWVFNVGDYVEQSIDWLN